MKAVYDKLTLQGLIGPKDETGATRPKPEYPKAIYDRPMGKLLKIVKDAREEMAFLASVDAPQANTLDEADVQQQALLSELNRLRSENEKLRTEAKPKAVLPSLEKKLDEPVKDAAKPTVAANPANVLGKTSN